MDWRKSGKSNPVLISGYLAAAMSWLKVNWLVLLVCIPVFRILFLSSSDGEFSQLQFASRLFFLPTLFLEIGIFVLAVASGLSLWRSILGISITARLLFLGWLTILGASLFYPDAIPGLAMRGTLFWIVHILFFAAAAHLIGQDPTKFGRPPPFLLTLQLAATAAGVAIMVFVWSKGLESDFSWNENLPGFNNLRHTGYIFAPAIAIGLAHLAAWPQKSPRIHMALLCVNTAIMLWLGSRGPVLGILLGFGVCIFFFSEMRKITFCVRSTLALGTGALASVVIPIPNSPDFGAIQRFWLKGIDNRVTSGRIELWTDSLDLISRKPFFGYGVHQYQFASDKAMGMFKHPHQSILQFLFDWGFVGASMFLCLLAMLVYKAYFASMCTSSTKLISALVLSTLFGYSLVDGIYFYPYTIAISAVFLLLPIVEGNRMQNAVS